MFMLVLLSLLVLDFVSYYFVFWYLQINWIGLDISAITMSNVVVVIVVSERRIKCMSVRGLDVS